MNIHKSYRILSTLACLALILGLAFGSASASPTLQGETDFAAIDAYVTEQMNDLGIPGMALGIVQGGQIAHVQGFGVADSSGRAVTPQTPFYIGSVSKSFTALAVMQLVEAGKIDLDASVQSYLPWLELAYKEASAKVTVRNLLNQNSGIAPIDGDRFWAGQQGLEEHVRGLNRIQLTQPVGEGYQYSNLNYSLAGLVVEKVSGQSYADYMTQNIFKPLSMRHSYVSRPPALADGLTSGHHFMFGQSFVRDYPVPPSGVPGGGLIASIEDMTHYAIAHLDDGRYGSVSILSAQGVAELHAPAISSDGEQYYAMGLVVDSADGEPVLLHTGDIGNFHSALILMPDRDLGFILLANASGFEQMGQVDGMAVGVFNMLNGKAPAPVSVPINVHFIYWAVLLTPVLMIFGIAYGWRRWRIKGVAHIVLIDLFYAGLAILWLIIVPRLTESPLSSIQFVHPELGYAVLASGVLGIGWSVIYTVRNLMALKSK